jgi:hypothetical protein
MGSLKIELLNKLKHLPPFEQVVSLYENKSEFFKEMHNYLIGGLVISNPQLFMMLKPIDGSADPQGQWYVKNPDTWYVRWVAGQGQLKAMMDNVSPLPFVMFRRITPNGDTKIRTYKWETMYRKVAENEV